MVDDKNGGELCEKYKGFKYKLHLSLIPQDNRSCPERVGLNGENVHCGPHCVRTYLRQYEGLVAFLDKRIIRLG